MTESPTSAGTSGTLRIGSLRYGSNWLPDIFRFSSSSRTGGWHPGALPMHNLHNSRLPRVPPTIDVMIPTVLEQDNGSILAEVTSGSADDGGSLSGQHVEATQHILNRHSATDSTVSPRTSQLQANDATRALRHHSETLQATSQVVLPEITAVDNLDGLRPILPDDLRRYKRDFTVSQNLPDFIVEPFQHSYETSGLPRGWVRFANSEGKPYFYHEQMNTVTDEWIYNSKLSSLINSSMERLRSIWIKWASSAPEGFDEGQLVLQWGEPDEYGTRPCDFYFVNHRHRLILWPCRFTLSWYLGELKGDVSREHAANYLGIQYWQHYQYYSEAQPLLEEDSRYAFSCLVQALADKSTSKTSTFSMSQEQLQSWLAYLRAADSLGDPRWLIGRFMTSIAKDRYYNFYNTRGARLSRTDSVYGPPREDIERSRFFQMCSACLVFLPDKLLGRLEKLYVDDRIGFTAWTDFHERMTKDQWDVGVFSTILLTTNMGLLDIDTVDSSLIRILSYFSAISAFGSVMTVLVVVFHCRQKEWVLPDAHDFLSQRYHSNRNFEYLALAYSLPGALLQWSIILLLAAFLAMCTVSKASEPVTRISVGIWGTLIGCLVIFCIQMFWEREASSPGDTDEGRSLPLSHVKVMAGNLRRKLKSMSMICWERKQRRQSEESSV